MGGYPVLLQCQLGLASVGIHHVAVGDDVGRSFKVQFQKPAAQIIKNAPPGDYRIAATRMMNHCGQILIGHFLYLRFRHPFRPPFH